MQTQILAEQCTLTLKQLVLEQLNPKQRIILEKVRQFEGIQVSSLVLTLKDELQCTDSAIWKTIRSLRDMNLLSESNKISLNNVESSLSSLKNRLSEFHMSINDCKIKHLKPDEVLFHTFFNIVNTS